jgi:hypothetical protein
LAKQPASNPQATSAALEVFWPLDLLPHCLPNARIATFGYDSKVTNWFKGPAMQLDVFSYGESLLGALEARRRADPERPIIFIVHSLGGLILKDVGSFSYLLKEIANRHCHINRLSVELEVR